eukprot:994341-Pelagomonas_calceolata.AAC.3
MKAPFFLQQHLLAEQNHTVAAMCVHLQMGCTLLRSMGRTAACWPPTWPPGQRRMPIWPS